MIVESRMNALLHAFNQAYRVWLQNGLSSPDRHRMLARACWKLTYHWGCPSNVQQARDYFFRVAFTPD